MRIAPSGCSIATKITVDTTAPSCGIVSFIGTRVAVHDSHSLTAELELFLHPVTSASQVMKVYPDPSCSTQVGTDYTYANNATSDQAAAVSGRCHQYYFQVTVEDNAGNTTISACSSAVAAYLATTANTVFEPSPGFTREGIPMSWDPRANATGYLVYRQEVGSGDIAWTPTDGTTIHHYDRSNVI